MKKLVTLLSVFFALSAVSATASAGGGKDSKYYKKDDKKNYSCYKNGKCNKKFKKDVEPTAVPEIDAASAAIALALMAGIISIGRERRKKA